MDENEGKLPIDDPRYRIEGTNMINFSKWSRENEPKPDHEYAEGDIVILTITAQVKKLTRDCDGTALYQFHEIGGNWSEDTILRKASDEEADEY